MIFELKNYQERTLSVLHDYLEVARTIGPAVAYRKIKGDNSRYQPLKELENIPYICLRLPTGGGKTLLSAHSIKIAGQAYLEREYPLVLWLLPTNTIRAQTLETLQKPGHPNYETLHQAFGGRVRVLDIADFTQITPSDIEAGACVLVGTFATFRVSNSDGRKVYAHNENLEPHFTAIPANSPNLERNENDGKIKFSFRNLLASHRPLVIVDEAHNNHSPLSVEVLQRVNAACVIEFTATPAQDSNILHNVAASELKTEEMIKLPIRLSTHNVWEEAVRDSILNRKRLHDLALKDQDYIRPIILFQAEEKSKDEARITKEVLLKHLVEQEKIPREKIAIVTGDQKELDGINLLSQDCPIDFVITVEALKEGWDCSFAYVFCSVASIYSKKDVEQILGRVLRMPYAKRRADPELNRAYAHVAKSSWQNAVSQLHDSLVDMGFEYREAVSFIDTAPPLPLSDGGMNILGGAAAVQSVFELPSGAINYVKDGDNGAGEQGGFKIEPVDNGGSRIVLNGNISPQSVDRLLALAPNEPIRKEIKLQVDVHNAKYMRSFSPAEQGVRFTVPQLYFHWDGDFILAEKDAFLDVNGWSLNDYPADISEVEFALNDKGVQWEIDLSHNIHNEVLTERLIGQAEQYNLDLVDTGWAKEEFCRWLQGKARQDDITQAVLMNYVSRSLDYLLEVRGLPLTALVRWRFVLAKIIIAKIGQHRLNASKNGYQMALFGPQKAVETSFEQGFDFKPDDYVPHWCYEGYPINFQKHYYADIGELKNSGEEFECAKAIDSCSSVKHWVRNLVGDRRGFGLPLANGKFYPDFIAELNDGRIFVIEYKGKVYATNDDSKEKNRIGQLWEEQSNGKALFLMVVDGKGQPSIADQITNKIKAT